MIKHEEARNFLCLLPAKLNDFYSDYITEQEKKDELLELYRELVESKELSKRRKNNDVNRGWEGIYRIVISIKEFNKIKALEEALK